MSNNDRAEPTFIIALPSNDPSVIGGTNANYAIQLETSLNLDGLWQLSLLELIYEPTIADQTLYVYTNIIKPQIVGSQSVQLVKAIAGVPTLGKQLIYRQPDPQEWRTINLNSIQQIEITIRDGTGTVVTLNGDTVVSFLLRRVR